MGCIGGSEGRVKSEEWERGLGEIYGGHWTGRGLKRNMCNSSGVMLIGIDFEILKNYW
jgi:hypothetical protein